VGRLSASDISVTAEVYDPEVHYNEVRRKWFGISITRPDGTREKHDFWPTQVTPEPKK
jgi:outer membrane protein